MPRKMSDTTAAVNKTYFNKLGSDYDEKFREALTMLEEELRRHKDFIAMRPGGRVLDYACGTGLLTNALSDQASECIGVDVSETMIERYNAKSSLEGPKRKAYLGNLISKDEQPATLFSGAEFSGFDFAGVGMGFHHFDDPVLAATRLAERLAPGGVLFIVDFEPHGALGAMEGQPAG
uniref:Methyltransferase domain-containing protein n=1 Tax=Bionectria ochroleuca TaxID=29856 RepID=A0A8H7NMB8_BIOOC